MTAKLVERLALELSGVKPSNKEIKDDVVIPWELDMTFESCYNGVTTYIGMDSVHEFSIMVIQKPNHFYTSKMRLIDIVKECQYSLLVRDDEIGAYQIGDSVLFAEKLK
jgi:hypothetical protein